MKFSLIFGTRPEIIKLSLIANKLRKSPHQIDLVFTSQHYDYFMSTKFIEELNLPPYDFVLNCNHGSELEQISSLLLNLEQYLRQTKPDMVIVQGDTNTTLAGALAANKLGMPIVHIEAGCRSFDMRMPEEINRRIVDTISTLLFAPTEKSRQNLLREGIEENKVFLVGSTLWEVCQEYYLNCKVGGLSILDKLGLKEKDYLLLTIHRQENTDVKDKLMNIINALPHLMSKVIFPIHPRTLKRLKEFNLFSLLKKHHNVEILEPVGYFEFLSLLSNSKMVMTDSGGVQEESAIFHIPCCTLMEATPWWETVEKGANILVGAQTEKIISQVNKILCDRALYDKMCRAETFTVVNSSDLIIEKLLELSL